VAKLISSLLTPVRALRVRYVPLLVIYFAYGALGLIDVTRDMWIKESLTLSAADLAGIGVWLSLPWTLKMVVGALADSVAILGSQRRSYVLIGAACVATGLIVLAGAAGGWIGGTADGLYLLGALLIVIGTVVQDVVADAMSAEVVPRTQNGRSRSSKAIKTELGIVQVLGRLSLSVGILAVAGLSGVLAQFLSRETVFLLGLIIPAISVAGVLFIREEAVQRRPLDWRIVGGGFVFATCVLVLAVSGFNYSQEAIFVVSMIVIVIMLAIVTSDVDPKTRRAILYTTIIVFAFRATPSAGDGYFWWTLDVLKFDEAFYGILRQTGALIAFIALWVFSRQLTEYPIATVLLWLACAEAILTLPNIGLVYGLHHWTEATFGIGARSIALIDTVADTPLVHLSMVPLLALIAYHAPPGKRATWFALMASLMNMALVAGQLETKYLNQIFVIQRGEYSELGPLLIVATVLSFLLPVGAVLLFGRRAESPA
jgi:MFS family permease